MQKLNESDDVYTVTKEVCDDSGEVIIYHKKNGLTHRHERDAFGNTLPAVIFPDGSAEWWIDGKLHRESDLPARICVDEDNEDSGRTWFFNGLEHRDSKDPITGLTNPSYISKDGATMRWSINGVYQRESDLPAMVFDSESIWFVNGTEGRKNDLPAIEGANGYKAWLKDGQYHRDGGEPAVIKPNSFEWWVNGKFIRKERR
jgi:hypothetical protein